jgi:hypothetical protein
MISSLLGLKRFMHKETENSRKLEIKEKMSKKTNLNAMKAYHHSQMFATKATEAVSVSINSA